MMILIKVEIKKEKGVRYTSSYASCETLPQLTVRVAAVLSREVVKLPNQLQQSGRAISTA